MSLAQLRPQPRPEFPLPNENFHLQVVSVFCSRCFCRFSFALLLLLPIVVLVVVVVFYVSLIFLAHIIKVASQVASLPLVAREFFFFIFYFFCISFASRKTSLIRFSPAVFSAAARENLPPVPFIFFLLSQFSVMKTLQSFR